MTISENDNQLDQLFEEWFNNQSTENPLPLKSWLDRFPQFTDEFISWTANNPLVVQIDTYSVDGELENSVLDIGMKNFLQAVENVKIPPKPISSLLEAGSKVGLPAKELAQEIGIGKILLGRLNQRLIEIETIPSAFIAKIAAALQVEIDQIRDYLSQPARLNPGVSYKADQAPRAGDKQTFQSAVQSDSELSPDQKAVLMDQ